jgi:hypothetical protein
MQHESVRGVLRYRSWRPEHAGRVRGYESFLFTRHTDGRVTMRAWCELELPEPTILREVSCGYDPQGRVADALLRLTIDDRPFATAIYRREGDELHLSACGPDGRLVTQSASFGPEYADLMMHPVVGDGYYTRHADVRRGPHVARVSLRAVSADHRGASFPALSAVTIDIAYLGDESVTVAAGTFRCHHFQYRDPGDSGLDGTHPTIDLWVTADGDYVYVKGKIGGYFQSDYELVSYEKTPAGSVPRSIAGGLAG